MNILLYGNGFDLYHGLPTSYLSFLKTIEYLKEDNGNLLAIGQVFLDKSKECKDINTSYTAYQKFYDNYFFDGNDLINLNKIKRLSISNCWLNYFLNTYNNKPLGWIDFEKEISIIVNDFKSLFNKFEFDKTLNVYADDVYFYREDLPFKLNYFDFFYKKEDNFIYIKNGYYMYDCENNVFLFDKEAIIKELYKELRNLSKMLKYYLLVFVDNTLEKLKEKNLVCKNNLFEEHIDYAISFNYTNTLKKLYKEISTEYIHGSLYGSIVLGINPDEDDTLADFDDSFIKFKKYFQRVYYRTDVEFVNNMTVISQIDQPKRLIVFGHSLDITDEDVIKKVFDLADTIDIAFHSQSALGDQMRNLIAMYSKEGFDELRAKKRLRFIPCSEIEEEIKIYGL